MAFWILYAGFTAMINTGSTMVTQQRTTATNASMLGTTCIVSLPAASQCSSQRNLRLQQSKTTYKISPSKLGILYQELDMSATALSSHYQSDSLNAHWMGLYKGTIQRNLAIGGSFFVKHAGQEFKKMDNYQDLFENFVKSQKWNVAVEDQKYFKFPFQDPQVPFQKIIDMCKWREDQYFTEQRLAGANPMSIQRVSYYQDEPGTTWSQLLQKLNPTFPWWSVINKTIGNPYLSLEETLQGNYVYLLQYPEYDSLVAVTEQSPFGRSVKKAVSPIAIFVSKPRDHGPNKLVPVAIQMGHTQDSPVYTPDDKPDEWLFAKQTVQVADFAYGQTIEHLLKTHIFMEPICASIQRNLDLLHPLHQIFKYHCRGVFGTNKFGGPFLLNPYNGTMEKLFAVGFKGANSMMSKAVSKINWDMTDFQKNIKDRGLDDKKKVPFYPYRDDGQVIHRVINDLSKEYVDLYYTTDTDVENDNELQDLIFEIYDVIKIPGFPDSVKDKNLLQNILTRLMWMTSAQHSAVNYPGSYYAAFTPNMPCKLYDDSRVTPGDFNVLNFPGVYHATIQATITMTLTAMHYDTLFDYGNNLADANARALFAKYATLLNGTIKNTLEERNRQRYVAGHLTYPYLVPGWIANSIHT